VSKFQSKHRTSRRCHQLERDDSGESCDPRPWWKPRGQWPPGVHFDDAATVERLGGQLPPRPAIVGFGNSASLCAEDGED
jgi:hypothetical protein